MRVSLSADVGSIVAQFVSAEGERAGPQLDVLQRLCFGSMSRAGHASLIRVKRVWIPPGLFCGTADDLVPLVLLQVQHAHRKDVLRTQLLDQLDDIPDGALVRLEALEGLEQLW